MTTYAIYAKATGEFTGRAVDTADTELLRNFTPDGCGAMPGTFDPLRQRVNVATGEVERWESPQIAALQRRAAADAARSTLQALDVRALRALSDLAVTPTNAEALLRVLEIEALKEAQREIIRGSNK